MNNLEWAFFFVFFMIGLIPAVIASRKGRDFLTWWVFGDLFFPIALPLALIIKQGNPDFDEHQLWQSNSHECPFCGGINSQITGKCRFCGQMI